MPHQCLKCGHAFAEGSSDILSGCPKCKGTKFFYTQNALGDDERRKMAEDANKDLRQVVTEMLSETSPEVAEDLKARAGSDGWAELKPKDLRKLVKQVQNEHAAEKAKPAPLDPEAELSAKEHAKRRKEVAARARELLAGDEDAKPDTVTVGDGEYGIDVKKLLEKEPVVVQKDGAYLIHLPSLFQGKE